MHKYKTHVLRAKTGCIASSRNGDALATSVLESLTLAPPQTSAGLFHRRRTPASPASSD